MQIIREFAITVRYPIDSMPICARIGFNIFEFYRPFNHFLCAHRAQCTDNRVNVGPNHNALFFLQHDRRMSMTAFLTIFSRTNNSIREFNIFSSDFFVASYENVWSMFLLLSKSFFLLSFFGCFVACTYFRRRLNSKFAENAHRFFLQIKQSKGKKGARK